MFQLEYQGTRYRRQLKGAGAGDTSVIISMGVIEAFDARKAQQVFYQGGRSRCQALGGYRSKQRILMHVFRPHVLIDKEAVLGLASAYASLSQKNIIHRIVSHQPPLSSIFLL